MEKETSALVGLGVVLIAIAVVISLGFGALQVGKRLTNTGQNDLVTSIDYAEYTHMKKSSFGGTVPINGQKNPPHITPINNLYFVGQQSENGGGLGAVILGSKSCYEKFVNKKN